MDKLAAVQAIAERPRHGRLDVIESALDLALEIAREGREGVRVGTLFTIGRAAAVLARSRPLVLDPLARHVREVRQITALDLRGVVAIVVSASGAVRVFHGGCLIARLCGTPEVGHRT